MMAEASTADDRDRITHLLGEAARGNREALDRLLPLVYEELRVIARGRLRSERPGHTLNTTALVHEAYLRLVVQTRVEWQGRSHFFAVASEAMRRILVDYAKRRKAGKRGGGADHLPLDMADDVLPTDFFTDEQASELIALDDALERLAGFNPRGARIIQYRYFGGLSTEEIAEVMETSARTVRRSWVAARAWLHRELTVPLDGARPSLLGPDPT